jgi:hypothetical protein
MPSKEGDPSNGEGLDLTGVSSMDPIPLSKTKSIYCGTSAAESNTRV